MQDRDKKRILILGGGFAGVECTLKLESYFKNNPNISPVSVSQGAAPMVFQGAPEMPS